MSDCKKIRFIEWHKDSKVYRLNCVIMVLVFILLAVMNSASVGFIMISMLRTFLITYFLISDIFSKYNTFTILVNNFVHILFSEAFFVFWAGEEAIAIPCFIIILYFTKKLVFSAILLAIISLIFVFVAKKIAKYFKDKINSWVF